MPLSQDEAVNETSDALVKTMRGAFGTPESYRPAHAKGRLLRGTFTPTSKASTLSCAPHFTSPSTPLLARFSSSTGLPHIPDTNPNGNPRGLALRFLLSADEHHHTDIVAHSTPSFPMRTGAGFLSMLRALGDGSIGAFLEANPSAAAFVQAPKPNPVSFATERYFGVNAYTLVSAEGVRTSIRYRVAPEAGVETLSLEEVEGRSETYLFEEIEERVKGEGDVGFKLLAQVARDGDPTDDATKLWPEDREVVELGTIKLEKILDEGESKKLQKQVIFDPIPRVKGVEASDDPLLDVRAAVYLISGKGRRAADLE